MFRRVTLLTTAVCLLTAMPALASRADERTLLTFSAPVTVPGATLPPGSYIFKVLDSNSHIVQILPEDGSGPIATLQAIPLKRLDPTEDIVLKFSPTEAGSPAALVGWFYPGAVYGHELVYSGTRAALIADRGVETLVLSNDVPGTELARGTLDVYDTAEY